MHSTKSINNTIRESLHVAKGLGIVLVVLGHIDMPDIQPPFWFLFRDVIYTFHMPLFMLVSGVLLSMTQKPVFSWREYAVFMKKKTGRLLLPYISITLILLLVKLTTSKFFTLSSPVSGDILYYIFLNPWGGFSNILWFIYTLFVIFLLFPLLRMVVRKDALLFTVTVLLSFLPWPPFFSLNLAFQHLPFFAAGYFLQRIGFFQDAGYAAGIMLPLFCYIVFFSVRTHVSGHALASQAVSLVLGVSGSLVCVTAASFAARKTHVLADSVAILGIYSGVIYLLHTITMGGVKVFLIQVMHLGIPDFLFISLALIGAGLVLPIIAGKYLIKRSAVASRFILGVEAPRHDPSSA